MDKNISSGQMLLRRVRAGFVSQGITLHEWCVVNEVLYPNARQSLLGTWAGPKGIELKKRILHDSGVNHDEN
ncbi:hypothetical protein GTGU_04144 [Trabulsiella guamensis ATCC 49490]|uniref:Uncharacterized protein n=2 Tax=Trabulsiella guamensis TaxID=158852 RepID=A0A084ZNV0_9ENTR|nr:hypothetical protein GTGU_04144 [Trabulsiella guamensis ATCC 49490]